MTDASTSAAPAPMEGHGAYNRGSRVQAACNTVALIFPHNSAQRRIAITARGDMREANGEART